MKKRKLRPAKPARKPVKVSGVILKDRVEHLKFGPKFYEWMGCSEAEYMAMSPDEQSARMAPVLAALEG